MAWTDSQPGVFLLMILLAPVALATTVCMSGGAWRVFLAYSESDPAWVALRRFFSFGRTRTPRPVTPAQAPERSGVA
ncbi:hypothetical protein [Microbacterium lushaniae]|uniref:Uncharacterized protein n=1 Tax=Microbacterium lushaniae TaxID=2614639 RepID=A0A5J6L6F2_9MICO|nr:hypothetical protein [Microbacterium lushaniae]QEW03995.1 hypothetical protein F6J85_13455 [Microbacterium lushaniae]